jgi:hypothetical protein
MSSIHLRSVHAEPLLTQVGPFRDCCASLELQAGSSRVRRHTDRDQPPDQATRETLGGAALPSQAPSPLALGWAGEQLSAVFRDGFERSARAGMVARADACSPF